MPTGAAPARPRAARRLRHTFCSHLAMLGAPAAAVQELAGHADLATTLSYIHLSPGAKESTLGLLDERERLTGSAPAAPARKKVK